jgi:molybdopterin molybdotransferase
MVNGALRDSRVAGFGNRTAVSTAWAWLDEQPAASTAELVPLVEAGCRVLSEPVVSVGAKPARAYASWPPTGGRPALDETVPMAGREKETPLPQGEGEQLFLASENGYAVRAADCDGANAYNPLMLTLSEPRSDALASGCACPIASGWALPGGADAVLPLDAAQLSGARSLEVLAPVAPGTGIARLHQAPRAGAVLFEAGHRLRPQDLACIAAIGISHVQVLRRPCVAIVVPGAKSGPDALSSMLFALLTRDDASVEQIPVAGDDVQSLATALAQPTIAHCALVLLAGRSGEGLDDTAALAVQAAGGTVALHGLALRPGGASGLGTLPRQFHDTACDAMPILLLPGEPFACLVAYDMLAARLVRRLSGAEGTLPYPVANFVLARKIVSTIGTTDVVPVRVAGDQAQPIGIDAGLPGAVQADGFVVVADASEGFPAGALVRVHSCNTRSLTTAQEKVA